MRQLVGYQWLGDPAQAAWLNQLYTGQWNTLRNYLCSVMKLAGKERDGGQVTRRYDAAQTPFQRLIASGKLPAAKQRELEQTLARLNLLALKRELERNLRGGVAPPTYERRSAADQPALVGAI